MLGFLFSETCLLSFSTQNYAESSGNYFKKSILDPKHAKLNQKSIFGVSGGQGFPPKIPPSFTQHLDEFIMILQEAATFMTFDGMLCAMILLFISFYNTI